MKNKFKESLSILLLIGMLTEGTDGKGIRLRRTLLWLVVVLLLCAVTVQAAVPYPAPHRPWLKVGVVAYQSTMSQAQIDWAAKNIDWFDNPHEEFLAQYKALTNAPMMRYMEYCSVYTTDAWVYGAMKAYATSHAGNVEDMFIHYETGEKVPCVVGSWSGDRYFTNPKHPLYVSFIKEFMVSVTQVSAGVSYDGVFIDDAHDRILERALGGSGGPMIEYPNTTTRVADYDRDILALYDAVRTVFAPLGLVQVANPAEYNYPALAGRVDGVFHETLMLGGDIGNRWARFDRLATNNAKGTYNVIGFAGLDNAALQIEALAAFYIRCNPAMDYFWVQGSYSGNLQTEQWFPALGSANGDVGIPTGAYTSAGGSAYQRDYTKALILLSLGGSYKFTLPSGSYRPLNADGTLGSSVSGSITLGNEVGAILMKSGTTPPPPNPSAPTGLRER